ncbi:hypothetical protein GCM10027038_38990 [Arthrobacter bambusae]
MKADRIYAINTVSGSVNLQARCFEDGMDHLTNVIVILNYYSHARCAHVKIPISYAQPTLTPAVPAILAHFSVSPA